MDPGKVRIRYPSSDQSAAQFDKPPPRPVNSAAQSHHLSLQQPMLEAQPIHFGPTCSSPKTLAQLAAAREPKAQLGTTQYSHRNQHPRHNPKQLARESPPQLRTHSFSSIKGNLANFYHFDHPEAKFDLV